MINKTKVICTIGPASSDRKVITELILKGMDAARLNFSHGDYTAHLKNIKTIREVSKSLNNNIPIIQDLQGPKIRAGKLLNGKILLREGMTVRISSKSIIGNDEVFSTTYKDFVTDVNVNENILMDDGLFRLTVISKNMDSVICKVIKGGILKEHKGINLPNTKLSLPSLTIKDKKDLKFGLKSGVDAVALSFVRKADDIINLRKELMKHKKDLPIISKIERPEAVNNIDEIIDASDIIMIARGDMGVEISPEDVPIIQKQIIRKCNSKMKPVITATQMLESMINNRIPTRAEAADVANAILDGSDCVMLSAETSVGVDPVNVVDTMEKIILKAEQFRVPQFDDFFNTSGTKLQSLCKSAMILANEIKAKAIVTYTRSGNSPRYLSRFRINTDIISITRNKKIASLTKFHWGVNSVLYSGIFNAANLNKFTLDLLRKSKTAVRGDKVILILSTEKEENKSANTIKIIEL
ncbi:MAG: pyruvate kinase [Ignavibacteria bacterium]|nr:pyruvate kinase [Ignavibacteria bacterium]